MSRDTSYSSIPNATRRSTIWATPLDEEAGESELHVMSGAKIIRAPMFLPSALCERPLVRFSRDYKSEFTTKSKYSGDWTLIGIDGEGTYTFPHGVVYEGQFKDGMFHGDGKLTYPRGQVLRGVFKEGQIVDWKFAYDECTHSSIESSENLANYCMLPDRRYIVTREQGFRGAGDEYLTNAQPTRKIPPNHYDVGDGFYNPRTRWVHNANDLGRLVVMPQPGETPEEVDVDIYLPDGSSFVKKVPLVPIYKNVGWIVNKCRKAWDENTGYRPDLYEYWTSGRREEMKELNMRTQKRGGRFATEESICLKLLQTFQEIARKESVENEDDIS